MVSGTAMMASLRTSTSSTGARGSSSSIGLRRGRPSRLSATTARRSAARCSATDGTAGCSCTTTARTRPTQRGGFGGGLWCRGLTSSPRLAASRPGPPRRKSTALGPPPPPQRAVPAPCLEDAPPRPADRSGADRARAVPRPHRPEPAPGAGPNRGVRPLDVDARGGRASRGGGVRRPRRGLPVGAVRRVPDQPCGRGVLQRPRLLVVRDPGPVAAAAAWRRAPRTGSRACSPRSRSASGCCRCRWTSAWLWRGVPSWCRPRWRS